MLKLQKHAQFFTTNSMPSRTSRKRREHHARVPLVTALRPQGALGISVVSYNVLASRHERPEDYPHVPADVWPHRISAQMHMIRRWAQKQRVDVICLQEVLPGYFQELSAMLGDYEAVLQQRKNAVSLCATFFRRDRWKQMWVDHRSRAVLLGLAQHGAANCSVAVGNVHLTANAVDAAQTRLSQMRSALKRMRARNPGALLVAGDFNDRPGSAVTDLLSENMGAGTDAGARPLRGRK